MSGVTPSPMPTPDLAGLLRRTPDPPPPVASPEEEPPPAELRDEPSKTDDSTSAAAGTAPAQPKRPPRTAASSKPTLGPEPGRRQYLRSIAVYLPRSVHQQLRAQAAARGTTATALMLGAVNSTHDRLADTLARAQVDEDGGHNLFDIPQARGVSEPAVQTTIRVTDSQHQALAALAATHDVNRSQLIAGALRLYLG